MVGTHFPENRDILESDLIHLRRADGRDIDYFLHVNPRLRRCGLAMIYNPLSVEARRTIRLPLHYTGLSGTALVRREGGAAARLRLDRDDRAEVSVKVPANGCTWLVFERP